MIKHREKCTGKQLFACNICSEGFQTHHAMVVHIKKCHRIDSSFKTKGIFVGKTRVKNTERGKKTPLGRVNTILNFHFVLNCILAKPESDNYVKRIRYSARSQTEKISRASDIKSCILRSCVKLQQGLDTLSHTPSGRNWYYCTLYHSNYEQGFTARI